MHDGKEIFTEFFNWASERKDHFVGELDATTKLFRDVCDLLGESDAKEPEEVMMTDECRMMGYE